MVVRTVDLEAPLPELLADGRDVIVELVHAVRHDGDQGLEHLPADQVKGLAHGAIVGVQDHVVELLPHAMPQVLLVRDVEEKLVLSEPRERDDVLQFRLHLETGGGEPQV